MSGWTKVSAESRAGSKPVVVALVADLLFASKIDGAARSQGVTVRIVRDPAAAVNATIEAGGTLILVDLALRKGDPVAAIAALKDHPETAATPLWAFGPHTATELLRDARSAGADRVLARSAFVQELPPLLSSLRR